MGTPYKSFYLTKSGFYFAGLLLLAIFTFWPTYVSLPPSANNAYTHLHAGLATLWVMLLIVQPLLIRKGRLPGHRLMGKASYVLAPLFLLAVVLLAHSRLQGIEGERYQIQVYILWLQTSIGFLFALSWVLGIINRKNMALHARFMICTGLTLIDPVVIRLLFWIDRSPGPLYQWVTFGLTDLVFLILIFLERNLKEGRGVFPGMLAIFILAQIPALAQMTGQGWWQSFAAWFAALPLT